MAEYIEAINERFNRYMVECESSLTETTLKSEASFNRYMVECEYITTTVDSLSLLVLIDTWWNVNTSHLIRVALFEPF